MCLPKYWQRQLAIFYWIVHVISLKYFWREWYLTDLVTQLHLFNLLHWALSCNQTFGDKYSSLNISLYCIQVKIHFIHRKGKRKASTNTVASDIENNAWPWWLPHTLLLLDIMVHLTTTSVKSQDSDFIFFYHHTSYPLIRRAFWDHVCINITNEQHIQPFLAFEQFF